MREERGGKGDGDAFRDLESEAQFVQHEVMLRDRVEAAGA